MPKKKSTTTARQIIAWLEEGQTHAGELAARMEKAVARSRPGVTALRRLFRFDESLDTYRRKPRKSMAQEFFEKHGRKEKTPPPKSASELMERQWQREERHELEYKKEHGWAANVRGQISETVEDLENQQSL